MSDAPQYIEMITEVIEQFLFEPWDDITRERIEEQFRSKCPGPYRLVWEEGLNHDFMPRFYLAFDDSPESTAWILRWT